MFIDAAGIIVFLLVLARIVGFFSVAPLFSDRTIPQMLKLTMALWISLLLWFVVPHPEVLPDKSIVIIYAFVNEFFIGFLIGFLVRLIFIGIQEGGALMDMQMGLSVAAAFDPSIGGQTTIVSRTMFSLATVVFLITNSHHMMLFSFRESYRVIPLLSDVQYNNILQQLGDLGSGLFHTALAFSLPIMVIIFLLDFSLGLLARLAPQVNVFFLGFQIKPMLGLFLFMLVIPTLIDKLQVLYNSVGVEMLRLYQNIRIL
ncbi:MAG: flagellar biosynthetic protein FliR [Candidatus Margulisbacteria bacterium GWF2_35_9]|nr:MAG: flagellar biosynthetic protein FliR [Candidatus Margulisbacteria bacterium GWF2_35_9]